MSLDAGEDPELLLQADPPVIRVADTVRRRSTGPAVHALLGYLERVGFRYSPRLLGVDEHGREVLSYLPGSSGRDGWAQVVPEAGLEHSRVCCARTMTRSETSNRRCTPGCSPHARHAQAS